MTLKKKNSRKKAVPKRPIQAWGEKVNWERRVKAVCKPCWELKYCPYGPFVEEMPLRKETDDKSCRIFGHDCPVFSTAEPFTETKELRNISRSIPRNVQFRVLKRDNQICRECSNSVQEEEIEFDHIIPWSKGGCSDEHNVKLLCKNCNRTKGNRFEEEYLVSSVSDHLREPIPFSFVKVLFQTTRWVWEKYDLMMRELSGADIKKLFGRRKEIDEDKLTAGTFNDLRQFFLKEKPDGIKVKIFESIKYRWGFVDKKFHSIEDASKKYYVSADDILSADVELISRIGFYIRPNNTDKAKWLKQ